MIIDDQKNSRRFAKAEENMFRVTRWLRGRKGNVIHDLEDLFGDEAQDALYEALRSNDPVKLAGVLNEFCKCSLFRNAHDFEQACYTHLMKSAHTVLRKAEGKEAKAAELAKQIQEKHRQQIVAEGKAQMARFNEAMRQKGGGAR
jgi:hypothetical protein